MLLSLLPIFLCLLLNVAESRFCNPKTPFTPFHENVSLEALEGKWEQRFYLNNWYGGTYCMEMEVAKINHETQTANMFYSFFLTEPQEGDEQPPYKFEAEEEHLLSKATYQKQMILKSQPFNVMSRDYIGDHILTDYDTYLAIVYCDKMSQRYIGDVFIRTDVEITHRKQLRTLRRSLRARGMGKITESRKSWCSKPN